MGPGIPSFSHTVRGSLEAKTQVGGAEELPGYLLPPLTEKQVRAERKDPLTLSEDLLWALEEEVGREKLLEALVSSSHKQRSGTTLPGLL